MWKRIVYCFGAIMFAVMTMLFAAYVAFAKQVDPAKVQVIGTPASKHAECMEYGRFAYKVLVAKDAGVEQDEVTRNVLEQAGELKMPIDYKAKLKEIVESLFSMSGITAEEGANAVYRVCLRK